MSRERPTHAEAACAAKVRHPSAKAARAALRRQAARLDRHGKDRAPLVVYRCQTCGDFHVGNNDPDQTPRRPYVRERFRPGQEDEAA